MRLESTSPREMINGEPLVEPHYLHGADVDAKRRVLGGVQAGLETPNRRWALHLESTVRRFGGYHQQFATGYADFPTKTYHFRATALSTTMGLRYQLPVRGWRVLAGAGLSHTRWLGVQSGAAYDGISRRELEGFALPVSATFMTRINNRESVPGETDPYVNRPWGTYLEVGVQHQRWTLALSYRRSGRHQIGDNSSALFRQRGRLDNTLRGFLMSYGYVATPKAFQLTLGYRLLTSDQ
ncbi:hypothetical protein GCM10027048_28900 [Hymenobacter coalescens]